MVSDACAVALVPQPDPLRVLKSLVLDAVSSPLTKRQYEIALDRFIAWAAGRTFADAPAGVPQLDALDGQVPGLVAPEPGPEQDGQQPPSLVLRQPVAGPPALAADAFDPAASGDGWTYRSEMVAVEWPISRMIVKASAPAPPSRVPKVCRNE